jgi:hypothetical protein
MLRFGVSFLKYSCREFSGAGVVVDSGILVTPIADIILSLIMLTLLVRSLRPWFDSEYFFGAISGCFS